MKDTLAKVLFVFLVVAVVGGLIIWRFRANNAQPLSDMGIVSEENSTTSPYILDENTSGGGSSVAPVLSKSNQGTFLGSSVVPLPDLTKPIVINENISEASKKDKIAKIEALQKELQNNPSYYDSWLILGAYRKSLGDFLGAEEVWQYASTLRPDRYVAFSNLGDLYRFYLKDFSKAEDVMKKAVVAEPGYIAGYRNLHELYRYSYLEKSAQADDILKQGIGKNPKAIDLYISLAQYYGEVKMNGEAIVYYDKAIEIAKAIGNTNLAGMLETEKAQVK